LNDPQRRVVGDELRDNICCIVDRTIVDHQHFRVQLRLRMVLSTLSRVAPIRALSL
jgi:hypothetical protein